MIKILRKSDKLDDHMGCFGNFNVADPVCRKYCVLRLRCAVEQDQSAHMDLLEDLLFPEGYSEIMQ
ncbi:MAG: hypothetical protein ACOZF0_17105 [Thermodesulfobacteriota bacterium]